MPNSPDRGNRIPRLLNEKFSIKSYDGGIFAEGGPGNTYDIKNVLVPTRDTFHCSDNGTHKNLVLKCASEFTLTHIFVQAPRRRCTEPIRNCLVWVEDSAPSIELTKYYDDLPIDVIRSKYPEGEPIIVTTARDTLEGETELRPWRSGRYVHIKLFDTHSESQENIDIAAIGLVGFEGRVSFNNHPIMGPWSKRQFTPARNVHPHMLTSTFSSRGWCCDGRDFSGGCRGGYNDFNETSVYDVSFRCATCGFDLCDFCANDDTLGKVTSETAVSDLTQLRTDRGAQAKRVALNRLKSSLRSDPCAIGEYLKAGILTFLGRTKLTQSRDAAAVLSVILNRLTATTVGSREECDMWAASVNGEVKYLSVASFQGAESAVACKEIANGVSLNVDPEILVPVSNVLDCVNTSAKLFAEIQSDDSGKRRIAVVDESTDLSIRNALGETLFEFAARKGRKDMEDQLKEPSSPSVASPQARDVEMEMTLVEEEANNCGRKSSAEWLMQLKDLVGVRLIDQLAKTEGVLDQDLVKAIIRLCPPFTDSVKLLALRLLNSGLKLEVDLGVRLIEGICNDPNSSDESLKKLSEFRAIEWINKVGGSPPPTGLSLPVSEPEPLHKENDVSSVCEKLLRIERLKITKIDQSAETSVTKVGFAQVTTPLSVSFLSCLPQVELSVEPLCSLAQISACIFLTQPVVQIDYLRYCFELVGCVIDLGPHAICGGTGLVTGFEIYSELGLGVHIVDLVGSPPAAGSKRVVLAARKQGYTVVSREKRALEYLDLRAKMTLERIKNPNLVDEYDRLRQHSINSESTMSDSLKSVIDQVSALPVANKELVIEEVLDAALLRGRDRSSTARSVGVAMHGQSSTLSQTTHREDQVFSVRIQMDTSEVPFELIWPMIREEVFESIRPFMVRSWPGHSLLGRLEEAISTSVNSSGFACIARNLTRLEAESIVTRVSTVIQASVVEDREGAIAAENDRLPSQSKNEDPKIGQRVKYTLPALLGEDKWMTGFVLHVGEDAVDVDLVDEETACVVGNVPRACVGGGRVGGGSVRSRLREQLRRRIMEIGEAGQLRQFTSHPEDHTDDWAHHEDEHEDEEEVEESAHDDEDEDDGEEIDDVGNGSGMLELMNPSSDGADSSDFTLLEPTPVPPERIFTRFMAGDANSSALFMSIGDFLTGIGFSDFSNGPSLAQINPQNTAVLAREITGLARGSSLNAPIGERFSADDLLSARSPTEMENGSEDAVPQYTKRPAIGLEIRLQGSKEWTLVNRETEKFPLIALGSFNENHQRNIVLESRFSLAQSHDTAQPCKRQKMFAAEAAGDWQELQEPGFVSGLQLIDSLDKKLVAENQLYQLLKSVLARKIANQLDQAVILLADAILRESSSVSRSLLPGWVRGVCKICPNLIPESLRLQVMRLSSLPASLTVHWIQTVRLGELLNRRSQIQSDLNTDSDNGRRMQQLSQELSNVEERIVRNSFWLGCVKSCLVKLRKSDPDEFFAMSDALLKRVASSSSLLEIQFEGESGFGSAVTRSFFSELGKQFLRPGPECLWLTNSSETHSEFVSVGKRGLRLRPLASDKFAASNIADKAVMLGRLIGRALAEGYIVPLPISLETWAMIRDPSAARPDSALPFPGDSTDGEFIGACIQQGAKAIDQLGAVFLENGFSGTELIENGKEISVTRKNLTQFVSLAKEFFLHTGIDSQLSAIRQGIQQVLPLDSLLLFSAEELKTAVCGEDEIIWSTESLRDILTFHDGLGEMQDWLMEILVEYNNQQRSAFLDFVTSCPRLPPGGNLRIDVFSETIASSNLTSPAMRPALPPQLIGTPPSPPTPLPEPASSELEVIGYPRSRACVNHLYLPRYRSRQTLRERLLEAMVSSVHHDEITS